MASPCRRHSRWKYGGGDTFFRIDRDKLKRRFAEDRGFDEDIPKREMIVVLVAGRTAERILFEKGRSDFSTERIEAASENDYAEAQG